METYYLTFGLKYHHEKHPLWDGVDPDGWVAIEASDYEAARDVARSYFGLQWAFLYDPEHFDPERQKQRYYPKGELARLIEGEPQLETAPFHRWSPSDPGFHGAEGSAHLGNRIVGRLLPEYDPNLESYDVEYFHDDCLEAGMKMFILMEDIDAHVINHEMDWANPWDCAACGKALNA